jgi:glycosyltransferase involved in cell wall biosynthesis
VVAVSSGVAEDLVATTGLRREHITVIHNPVVTPELEERAQAPLEHAWFAPGEPPVVLSVGRLVAPKDYPTLVRAFARVRAVRPARLVILGEGSQREALLALAAKLGIADDVTLPGFVANPFAYVSRCAVFALSSAWEGFGIVLVEALALGCPVVSTDCPSGPAEILEHGSHGLLVPVGDDEAMAQAILSAIEAPGDPERRKARAAEFAVDQAVDRYIETLRNAISRRL